MTMRWSLAVPSVAGQISHLEESITVRENWPEQWQMWLQRGQSNLAISQLDAFIMSVEQATGDRQDVGHSGKRTARTQADALDANKRMRTIAADPL